jgi:hypothetical protein
MNSTAFAMLLMPLFQGFAFWFLILATARILLDASGRLWRGSLNRHHRFWR